MSRLTELLLGQALGQGYIHLPHIGVGSGGGLEKGEFVGCREVLALLCGHCSGRHAVRLVAHKDLGENNPGDGKGEGN